MSDRRDDIETMDARAPASTAQLGREFLSALYVMVKNSLIFELNNPTLQFSCQNAALISGRLREMADTALIEFAPDGVYINSEIARLDRSGFEHSEYLFHVWKTFGIGRIETTGTTSMEDWLSLVEAFKRFVAGDNTKTFEELEFKNIKLGPISEMGTGEDLAVTDRFRALRAHSLAVVALGDLIERLRGGGNLRIVEVKRPLHELISVADTSASLLLALAHLKRNKLDVEHHLANTAVFTICMARHLNLNRKAMSEIALQAALHGLGRAFVPEQADDLDIDCFRALESVCKLARQTEFSMKSIGRAVVAHEIRLDMSRTYGRDGESYPFETYGPSRMIAVAHAYDLLTTPRKHRPALHPDEALRVIMAEAGKRYDDAAVRLLANELGVYPVGSVVALSNGQTAVVVEAPRDAAGPERPRVKIIRNVAGTTIDGAIIDLAGAEGASLNIMHCIDAEEAQVNTPAFLLS